MSAKYTPDWIAQPHAVGLAGRLAQELESRGLPELCSLGVVPGGQVAWDGGECDGGMGWVRVASVFPSMNFPVPDEKPRAAIMPAVRLEVGLLRPVEVPDNGEATDPAVQLLEADLQMADMGAMLTALCAYSDAVGKRVLIETYTPVGPLGGLVGGSWTALFEVA